MCSKRITGLVYSVSLWSPFKTYIVLPAAVLMCSCTYSIGHFRVTGIQPADIEIIADTLRMVTTQGTLDGNLSSEEQNKQLRDALPHVPVLSYRNVYYAEPWDASTAVMRARPEWQLRGANGKPLDPEGKLVYNMTIPAVQSFYADNIANLTATGYADGAFGDSGCGARPSWLSTAMQEAFALGQFNAAALAQQAIAAAGGIFVSNCPYVIKTPTGGVDPWPRGVGAIMYQSWCSDFLTGVGGPHSALYCRDEILSILSGPKAWNNGSMIQARYYLSGHNGEDPRFGVIAYLIAAYEGMLFGASTDWNWDGDWQRQSLAFWAREPLGAPNTPHMLDGAGCGWNRTFASGASAFVNLCAGKGHPLSAHVWVELHQCMG
eukprot:m.182251 g.182251  ORF g.182251 m.182251 type:complete len:377 (+) comp18458_c1_seq7:106-1236(+)